METLKGREFQPGPNPYSGPTGNPPHFVSLQPFYLYGRLIGTLELGARAHGRILNLEFTTEGAHALGGLREPLRKHLQSGPPLLERRGRSDRFRVSASTVDRYLKKEELAS